MKLEGKTVCVVGGAGFLGSTLCEKLVNRRPERIIVVDDFSMGERSNLSGLAGKVEVRLIDAVDFPSMERLYTTEEIEVTFNLAVVSLPVSLITPKEVIDINVLSVSNLCELLRLGLYKTLIHVSSSEAYGTAIYDLMNEAHPTQPITPYAASKLAGDHIVLSYHRTFRERMDVAIARPFNSFGPKQNEKRYAAVIPITIKRILNGEPPIIHGDGFQTRDFSYSEDIVEGILDIYESRATRGRIINLATGMETRIYDLMCTISDLMDYEKEFIYTPPRPGDVLRHKGDASLAKELIGYEPKTNLREGLRRTIKWYKESL